MITPLVTAISGALAIVAVAMRLVDSLARDSLLHWSNFCVVLSLVRDPSPFYFHWNMELKKAGLFRGDRRSRIPK